MRLLTTFLLGALGLVSPVAAQQPPTREIHLSVACFRYVNGVNKAQLPSVEGEERVELAFFQGGFTIPQKVKIQGNTVNLMVEQPAADGTMTMKKIAGATIQENMREVSLLLLPAPPESDLVYNALVMPRQTEFPFGQVMTMNLTTTNVKFAIGKKLVELPPKAIRISDPKADIDDFNMYPVAIAFQTPDGSQWVTTHTTRWQWNERIRQVAIAWYDEQAKKTEVTTMRDIKPVTDVPTPAAPPENPG